MLQIRDVTPSIDIVGERDDREALDQAKKRAPTIRFSVLGIKPGTELQSVFDDTITSKVKDDRKVIFRDEEDSLSGSALKIAEEKGYKWTRIDGPSYWKYNGRTLREIKDDPDGLASDDQE